ncbi:hypothetical protein [Amycolatopsis sp. NPDC021455]|uniref:hypothetical protein n=1 Tax=Amycolatopsis sp. NPDC021455 TaxID=3154901 RepID=UPI0033EF1A57
MNFRRRLGIGALAAGLLPAPETPVTWMRSADQQPINAGDGKPALFPFGFGLRYPHRPW